jgi:hypothetical protein
VSVSVPDEKCGLGAPLKAEGREGVDGALGPLEERRKGGVGWGPTHKFTAPQLFFYFGPRWHLL